MQPAASACREFHQLARCNRRSVLAAGLSGMLGLGLPQLMAAQASGADDPAQRLPGFGKAKRCIFLFMWGGPSQLETFDMKPGAPDTIRGEFKPVSTKVPGLQICEHFKQLPALMDKVAVIRSLGHDDPAHLSSGHATVTGQLAPVLKSDKDPPSSKDSPHLGSVVSKLFPAPATLPSFVMLPWKAFHPSAPGGQAPGQHGGWLGPNFDPLLVDGDPNHADWKVPALRLQDGLTPQLLSDRYTLLKELDSQRSALDRAASAARMTGHQAKAVSLLSSPDVRQAFDLSQESAATRDRYGRNIHGQCVLLARRLIEQGVPIVNVNWHNDGQNFWDTHGNNFNRLKKDLIPPADQALAALLTDLSERGMLEDTIVAWVGEFGRRPTISNGSGREHWPYCYSGLLAGGGIAGGAVYGSSDAHASYPASNPVTPQDYTATMLHALGVSPSLMLPSLDGRSHAVYGGKPIEALFT
ncbi:MAG TPA: DUF1501 domain-containing protein [Pirellulaceae bacterium]|nr:DUF1501 domain-containing protein [Pirellulaceae bacterium]